MAQFGVEISSGNNWVDLRLKRFSRVIINTLDATSSTVDLVVGRNTLANTSDSVSPKEGNYIIRQIVIPAGAALSVDAIDVSNFKQKLGDNKRDDYTILARSSSGDSHLFIST